MTIARTLAFLVLLVPGRGFGQALPPDPAEGARIQVGPFSFRPTFEITNAGTDSNVFNDPVNPRGDMTATISPALQMVVRARLARLTYGARLDYVWFKEYEEERSTNARTDVKIELRTARFVPYASAGLTNTRERLSTEIDLRAERQETRAAAGGAIVLGPAAVMVLGLRQQETDFAEGQAVDGIPLDRELDGRFRAFDAEWRLELTPLTTFALTGTLQRDRFTFSPDRDSRSVVLTPALEFNPSALISGKVAVGYRHFDPEDTGLPDFDGVVAQADLAYILGTMTRVQGRLSRDVSYSYQPERPYYISFGGRITLTQQIAGPFDVEGTAGRQSLQYASRAPLETDDTVFVTTYGGGIGVRLADRSRISLNVEVNHRRGDVSLSVADYDRRRIYTSLTYEF